MSSKGEATKQKLMDIAERLILGNGYNARSDVSSADLADMLSTIIERGIIVSRALNDPSVLEKQLLEYRNYIELLYSPQQPAPATAQ